MRVVVTGWRNLRDASVVYDALNKHKITRLAEGGATGADRWAKEYAIAHKGITRITYHADWSRFGYSAGPIRNRAMLDHEKPDLLIAFLHPSSRGTADCIQAAKERGIPIEIHRVGVWPDGMKVAADLPQVSNGTHSI